MKDRRESVLILLFTGNVIGDSGATAISESLQSNTTLTQLDLNGSGE